MTADPRLILALDLAAADDARRLVETLDETVGFYKVGLTLLARGDGVALAHALRAADKQVFQDWKLHDIGAQVEGAAAAISEGGCDLFTVHAEPQVMRAAARGRAGTDAQVLAVTVLTSLTGEDLVEIGYAASASELVERRVRQAIACGVDGVVASPLEAARVRGVAAEAGRPDFLIVTPGIRPAGAEVNDQARVAGPAAALKAGATHLVVGRPITAADNPKDAALRILEEMAGV
jgi:orotidine-5'-phosphate decarboxylase